MAIVQKIEGFAGSEKYIQQLSLGLHGKGVDVDVLLITSLPLSALVIQSYKVKLEASGIVCLVLPESKLLTFKLLKSINKIIDERQYDLIHTNLIHADFYMALVKYFFKKKIRIISTKHGYSENFLRKCQDRGKLLFPYASLYYLVAKWSERYIDQSIAVSRWMKDFYERIGVSKNVKIVHNGLDANGTEWKINEKRYAVNQILLVGRVSNIKGHDVAVNVAEKLKEKGLDFKMVFLGKEDHLGFCKTIKNAIQVKGLQDYIIFEGFQTNVFDYYASSDVVIVPSISEPFGLIFLEAFMAGKPIVAYDGDFSAAREIVIHDNNGYLIKHGNMGDFASCILKLLEDKDLAARFGKNGNRLYNDSFKSCHMVDKTIDVYKSCLNEKY